MIEILWHGRGGQGAFTAARLLGAAYALKGDDSYSLAFPSFGPERRGAPVRAFTKLDCKIIGNRSESLSADYIIYLDDTLFSGIGQGELKPGGTVLINSKRRFEDSRIIAVDGDSIAAEILKVNITNTIMLGALCAVLDSLSLSDVENAIGISMPEKLRDKNIRALREAYKIALSAREVRS